MDRLESLLCWQLTPDRRDTYLSTKMESKKLELFLLAGCSCLLTLLCQPIASAVTSSAMPTALQFPVQLEGAYCKVNFQDKLTKIKHRQQ